MSSGATDIKGQSKAFWVEKARAAFESGLCRPEKGDVGEIFCALYLLFCGDLARRSSNEKMPVWSVPLLDWFCRVKGERKEIHTNATETPKGGHSHPHGGRALRSSSQKESKTEDEKTTAMKVSFIQFCRNHLWSGSFCNDRLLKYCYSSGVAFYTYSQCTAFDHATSICVEGTGKNNPSYHPLLVSVKNYASVDNCNVTAWVSIMKTSLRNMRKKPGSTENAAFCLLLLVGCSQPPEPKADDLCSGSLGEFPNQDIYRFVAVPDSDSFGISQAVRELGFMSERSELYSSHPFLREEESASGTLRSGSKLVGEAEELLDALTGKQESLQKRTRETSSARGSCKRKAKKSKRM